MTEGLIGLEKEGLRVGADGAIALTAHPEYLGSALTHPWITTDYSEALLEFVTPPLPGADKVLEFMDDVHRFVYSKLAREFLWSGSMPCILNCGEQIPLAQYGSSNAGQMKTIYRRGLGHRYGRVMQVIAGIHFNYSISDRFWAGYQTLLDDKRDKQSFVSGRYFHMIRNLQRVGWLVPYLFGASPAICKSFLCNKPTTLMRFDDSSYYEPYATSLRMGDIGYQNKKEFDTGLAVCYDNIDRYIESLRCAIMTPCPAYNEIGVKVNGRYEQLNANILQIENEYYSTVRPKQVLKDNEMPINALEARGVRYVELRSLDLNPYAPLGVRLNQVLTLEVLMLYCLLQDSPPVTADERASIDENLLVVAHRGREPGLQLSQKGDAVRLSSWAGTVLDDLQAIAGVFDDINGGNAYCEAIARQQKKVANPDETPSARMLQEMRQHEEGFYQFTRRLSERHDEYFRQRPLSAERQQAFIYESSKSIEQQQRIEREDTLTLDEYLARYFSQVPV